VIPRAARWRAALRRVAVPAAFLAAVLGGALMAGAPAVRYAADPGASRLEFTGLQAGAEFKGVFHKFTATVNFSPEALDDSRFDVQIDLNSLDTMDEDRDGTMRGADIFDVAHFPTAHYVTRSFAKTASGYRAVGDLTLRGVTKEVPVDFQFAAAAAGAKLSGSAKLKRLDFGVGQGEWKSTKSVADEVGVGFTLLLKPKP
jgi:polyisoprenoid-binding protein YceI